MLPTVHLGQQQDSEVARPHTQLLANSNKNQPCNRLRGRFPGSVLKCRPFQTFYFDYQISFSAKKQFCIAYTYKYTTFKHRKE